MSLQDLNETRYLISEIVAMAGKMPPILLHGKSSPYIQRFKLAAAEGLAAANSPKPKLDKLREAHRNLRFFYEG